MSQTHGRPDRGSTTNPPPNLPRWVKVLGVIALILVLLVVVSALAGVRHGPDLHAPSGNPAGDTPPSGVIADRTPPVEYGVRQS